MCDLEPFSKIQSHNYCAAVDPLCGLQPIWARIKIIYYALNDEGSYRRCSSTIWSGIVSPTKETAPAESTLQSL